MRDFEFNDDIEKRYLTQILDHMDHWLGESHRVWHLDTCTGTFGLWEPWVGQLYFIQAYHNALCVTVQGAFVPAIKPFLEHTYLLILIHDSVLYRFNPLLWGSKRRMAKLESYLEIFTGWHFVRFAGLKSSHLATLELVSSSAAFDVHIR